MLLLYYYNILYTYSWSTIQHSAHTNKKYLGRGGGGEGEGGYLKSKRKTTLIMFF